MPPIHAETTHWWDDEKAPPPKNVYLVEVLSIWREQLQTILRSVPKRRSCDEGFLRLTRRLIRWCECTNVEPEAFHAFLAIYNVHCTGFTEQESVLLTRVTETETKLQELAREYRKHPDEALKDELREQSRQVSETLAALRVLYRDRFAQTRGLVEETFAELREKAPALVRDIEVTSPAGSREKPIPANLKEQVHEPRHSEGYRMVWWRGEEFSFGLIQAACIAVLWETWPDDAWLLQDKIIDRAEKLIGDEIDSKRLSDIFRRHPAWGTMIVGSGNGLFKLRR